MTLTKHGVRRTRERLGIPKRAVSRMAERALVHGAQRTDFSGALRRYLDAHFHNHSRLGNNMRVYGEHLFIFAGETLITAWTLPNEYRGAARRASA